MAASLPKPLIELAGKPLLCHSLDVLSGLESVIATVVMCPAEQVEQFTRTCGERKKLHFIAGGASRQHSVRLGIQHISSSLVLDENDLILVHDAARCLLSKELARRCITDAEAVGAVTAAVPVVDTLVGASAEERIIENTVPRDGLWAVQTPQVFKFSLLCRAHEKAAEEGKEYTDDATLVMPLHPVHITPGEPSNFKVTAPDDLILARSLLESRI